MLIGGPVAREKSRGEVWCALVCLAVVTTVAFLMGFVIYPSMISQRRSRFAAVNFAVTNQSTWSDSGKFCSPCWGILLYVSFGLSTDNSTTNRSCTLYLSPDGGFDEHDRDSTVQYAQGRYPIGTSIAGGYCLQNDAAFLCPCVTADDMAEDAALSANTTAIVVGVLLGVITIASTAVLWVNRRLCCCCATIDDQQSPPQAHSPCECDCQCDC